MRLKLLGRHLKDGNVNYNGVTGVTMTEREKSETPILYHHNRSSQQTVKFLPLFRNLFQLSFTFFNLISISQFSYFFFVLFGFFAKTSHRPVNQTAAIVAEWRLPWRPQHPVCVSAGCRRRCWVCTRPHRILFMSAMSHSDPLLSIKQDKWGHVLISQLNRARSTKQNKTKSGPHNS